MKANRPTKLTAHPRGWIYGCRWSQVPVEGRVVLVTVGVAPKDWWCHGMEGTERQAIEVKMNGQTVYVDNEGNRALTTFLEGKAPRPKFRFVPAFFAKEDPSAEMFYKAKVFFE